MKLDVVIHPIQAWGHINACLGIAEALVSRNHKVTFMVDSSLKGHFTKLGYGETLLFRKDNKNSDSKDDSFVETAERYKKQFGLHMAEYHRRYSDEAFIDSDINLAITLEYEPQIQAYIDTTPPDLFIVDGYFIPGNIVKSGIPYISNWSSNPLMLFNTLDEYQNKERRLPPFGSGFALDGTDKDLWDADFKILERMFTRFEENQNSLYEKANMLPEQWPQNALDVPMIYGFPEELDYSSVIPAPKSWFRLDSYCRNVEQKPLEIPAEFYDPSRDKLVYFSLGTISSLDVQLLKKIMGIFSRMPYKFLVAKGLKSDEYSLPENCWGASMLPQIAAIEKADLVITHCGNNTITEALTLGKPILALPMFFDQFDNAQRIHEEGYGIRLDSYKFEEKDMAQALDYLLNDPKPKQKCRLLAQRIVDSDRKNELVDWIEDMCKVNDK